ncbi:MAG: transposase [Actinomyces succiniciruminis]|nr:transposase [Actinomyces succiniciruminis]
MNARKDHCRECSEEVSRGVAGAGYPDGCAGARRDPERSKGAIRRIAEELGVHPEALRTWVKKVMVDGGARPGTTTSDVERIKQLEAANRERRIANPGRGHARQTDAR